MCREEVSARLNNGRGVTVLKDSPRWHIPQDGSVDRSKDEHSLYVPGQFERDPPPRAPLHRPAPDFLQGRRSK